MRFLVESTPLIPALLAAACAGAGDAAVGAGDGGTDGDTDTGSDTEAGACDWEAELALLFPQDRVVEVAVDFYDDTAFDQMVAAAAADPDDLPFFPARLAFDGEILEDVGVRLKGNSSLWGSAADQTKSLKLDFEEYVAGRHFHCVDKLNLHNNFMDPSIAREALTYGMANDFGVSAPRAAHAEVTVDGARHGVFTLVQQVDAELLEERFGAADGADDGNLYKCEDGCPLAYWGEDPSYYRGYPPDGVPAPPCDDPEGECGLVLKTNEDDPELNTYADIVELVRTIDEVLAGDVGLEALDAIFDLDAYVRFQALNVALSNLDSYFGSSHNFYLYRRPADGRFQFIMWDTNLAYGTFECPEMYTAPDDVLDADLLAPCGPPPVPLAELVIGNDELRAEYCDAVDDLLADLFTAEAQAARFEARRALLDAARAESTALGQPPMDFTYEDYETAYSGTPDVAFGSKVIHALGYFVGERIVSLEAQLSEKCP
jgi:spore coat protein CotH